VPALDRLIATPGLMEINDMELPVSAERAWNAVRNLDLGRSAIVRTLFALRTIPDRLLRAKKSEPHLRIGDLISTPEEPGFQLLIEDPPREMAFGAIGKVWQPLIPFVHVPDARAFAAFCAPGYVKVAWALRVLPEGPARSRVELDVRVQATDETAWAKFKRYFRVIGPGSHFIRRILLAQLARDLARPQTEESPRLSTKQPRNECTTRIRSGGDKGAEEQHFQPRKPPAVDRHERA